MDWWTLEAVICGAVAFRVFPICLVWIDYDTIHLTSKYCSLVLASAQMCSKLNTSLKENVNRFKPPISVVSFNQSGSSSIGVSQTQSYLWHLHISLSFNSLLSFPPQQSTPELLYVKLDFDEHNVDILLIQNRFHSILSFFLPVCWFVFCCLY